MTSTDERTITDCAAAEPKCACENPSLHDRDCAFLLARAPYGRCSKCRAALTLPPTWSGMTGPSYCGDCWTVQAGQASRDHKEVTHGAAGERPELAEMGERAEQSIVTNESPAEKPTDGRGVDAASNADVRGDGHVERGSRERPASMKRTHAPTCIGGERGPCNCGADRTSEASLPFPVGARVMHKGQEGIVEELQRSVQLDTDGVARGRRVRFADGTRLVHVADLVEWPKGTGQRTNEAGPFARLVALYEAEHEPWPRPDWVSAELEAERLRQRPNEATNTEDDDPTNMLVRAGYLAGLALRLEGEDCEMVKRAARSLMVAAQRPEPTPSAEGAPDFEHIVRASDDHTGDRAWLRWQLQSAWLAGRRCSEPAVAEGLTAAELLEQIGELGLPVGVMAHVGRALEEPARPCVVEGPEIAWAPNGDAGDSSGHCSCCGEERDDPHSWQACAERLAQEVERWSGLAHDPENARRVLAILDASEGDAPGDELRALRAVAQDAREAIDGLLEATNELRLDVTSVMNLARARDRARAVPWLALEARSPTIVDASANATHDEELPGRDREALSQGPSDEDLFGAPPFRSWAARIVEKQFDQAVTKLAAKLEQAWKQGRRMGRRTGGEAERVAIVAFLRRRAAWLQSEIAKGGSCWTEMQQAEAIAEMVERGRHVESAEKTNEGGLRT